MNRRQFFKTSIISGSSLTVLGSLAFANEGNEEGKSQLIVSSMISRNHRHELNLNLTDLVLLLQEVQSTQSVEINIQGQSSHPHTLTLGEEALLSVLKFGQVEVESSSDRGHSHSVLISLEKVNV